MTDALPNYPTHLISADWGKKANKRKAYVGSLNERSIKPIASERLNLESLLACARRILLRGDNRVLISVDLALGVPQRFLSQAKSIERWQSVETFLDWVAMLVDEEDFWNEVHHARQWRPTKPFISIPSGAGSKNKFKAKTDLNRKLDFLCHSNSPWIVSGIPGSVGSGSRAFWKELGPNLSRERDFMIWPFEGTLSPLFEDSRIVVAESYPAISYTISLEDKIPSSKLIVPKTSGSARELALQRLRSASWIRRHGVSLRGIKLARENEDNFDALMACAAQLRCLLERIPLEPRSSTNLLDPVAEGGILLSNLIDFDQKGRMLS